MDKKDLLAFAAFIALLGVVAVANLSQQKDTDRFITKHFEAEEPRDETEREELKRLMNENMPEVALEAEPLNKSYEEFASLEYDLTGELEDVTEGKEIRGLVTEGEAGGMVKATLKDNDYHLLAEITGLPEAPQGTFYEGWVVRNNREQAFRFESTGKLEQRDEHSVNYFGSTKDLTDHRTYVVTIEPEDNDPAPADHVLEGTLE